MLLLLLLFANYILIAQCPTNDVLITTQAQLDAFAANFPGCNNLEVSLRIEGSDITDLSGLSQITSINGRLEIVDNVSLSTMNGLSTINFFGLNSELTIANNPLLTSLSNFTGSINTSDFSGILIQSNSNLTSLAGLSGLTSSNSLWIVNNDALTSLNGVENMSIEGTILGIQDNELLADISALSGNLGEFRSIQITDNPQITSLAALQGINFIPTQTGTLNLSLSGVFTSLNGLSSITNTPDAIVIRTSSASNLDALSNIQGSVSNLLIQNTESLLNLEGLDGITNITTNLEISGNNDLESLDGINGVINANNILSLSIVIDSNDQLTSIDGISNIQVNSVTSVVVVNNSNLSMCTNTLICDAIDIGIASFGSNAPGCNANFEVEQACELAIPDASAKNTVTIFPNPASSHFEVRAPSVQSLEIEIYSISGQRIYTTTQRQVDISSLEAGLYLVKIKFEQGSYTYRVIKK